MLESILMQAASSFATVAAAAPNATQIATQAALVSTYSNLVNAIALAVGAIAPIIVSILAFVKAKSHDPQINDALQTAQSVGNVATAISNKALENKESIKALTELAISAAPEDMKGKLAQKQALVDKVTKEIEATTAQLKRLTPLVPGKANADTIPDLPREKVPG